MALSQSLMWESQYEQKQQWMLNQLAECWAADDVWRIWEVELYKEQVVTKKGTKTFWNPTDFERC